MAATDIFDIILKVIGLLFIKDALFGIPWTVTNVTQVFQCSSTHPFAMLPGILLCLVITIFYLVISWVFIIKTDFLIDALKLDRGFDEEPYPINIHRSAVLSIIVIALGGLILISSVPALFRVIYLSVHNVFPFKDNLTLDTIMPVAEIIIGLLIIGEQRRIVKFIEAKRKR